MSEHIHHTVTVDVSDRLERLLDKLAHNFEVKDLLHQILRRLQDMPTQAEFDAQVASINDSITTLTAAVAAEAAQVQAFIESHPDLDTSALATVKSNLDALSTSVEQIDPQEVPAG